MRENMQRRTVLSDGPQGPESAASDVKVERSNDECSRGKLRAQKISKWAELLRILKNV